LNFWKNIKESSRYKLDYSNDELKTEKQWAASGYLANDKNCGKMLRYNRMNSMALYLHISEVHKASSEELKEYYRPDQERKKRITEEKKEEYIRAMIALDREPEYIQTINDLQKRKRLYYQTVNFISKAYSDKYLFDHQNYPKRAIVIDTETTGVAYDSEILQLSIIDTLKNVLHNELYKPALVDSWPEAQNVNNISPEMITDKPFIAEDYEKIQNIILESDVIIGYNTQFDIGRLEFAGFYIPESIKIIDLMRDFAPIYGEWNEKYGEYKWKKLIDCAAYYNYKWEGKAHDSLQDCLATLHCYNCMYKSEVHNEI